MSKYNSLNNTCECWPGYKIINGSCTPEERKEIQKYTPPLVLNTVQPTQVIIEKPSSPMTPTAKPQHEYKPPFELESLLKLKSTGSEVEILQAALATDSRLYPDGIVSGYYGKLTESAVKEFQKKYNLNITGEVNQQTLEKFNDVFGSKTNEGGKAEENIFIKAFNFIGNLFQ